MRRRPMTGWIAGTLALSLAGCGSGSAGMAVAEPARLGRVCPAPTAGAVLPAIADYLDRAADDPGLDALASEWERLDEGARIARGGR
jgi:hypothetical protein